MADYFAAWVLMPKRLVKQRYCQGQQRIEDLAGEFGGSPAAMRYRLQQLGLVEGYRRCERPPYRRAGELKGDLRRARAATQV